MNANSIRLFIPFESYEVTVLNNTAKDGFDKKGNVDF